MADFDYTVCPDGKRTAATEKFYGPTGTVQTTNEFDWTYDSMGRLISEVLDSNDDNLDYVDAFAFDLNGNRLKQTRDWGSTSKVDYATTYAFDNNDRLITESQDNATGDDSTTAYGYTGTQQTSKSVSVNSTLKTTQSFTYDLQGRMTMVRLETMNAAGTAVVAVEETSFEYDTGGTRIASVHKIDSTNDGTFETIRRTEYLTDHANPTGYSQTIMETETAADGTPIKRTVYTIGHDQISQSVFEFNSSSGLWSQASSLFFGTDGHGSARVLYDTFAAVVTFAANVLQVFHYDAYGNLLNMAATSALTSYLYSGEAFDTRINQQYLRARYYDPGTGRFGSLDPFSGRKSDPQSLHKYLYTHGDPVNGIDPNGEFVSLAMGALGVLGLRMGSLTGSAASLGFASGLLADFTLIWWLRSAFPRDGKPQLPKQAYDSSVTANKNYVRIVNSDVTADEMFQRILEFNREDFVGSPTIPQRHGAIVTWSLAGLVENIGQQDFDVQIDQVHMQRRLVSVVTLGGHPLSGFRYWQVLADSGDARSFTIATGAVEHNTSSNDWFKATIGGPVLVNEFPYVSYSRGNIAVLKTWEAMLRNHVNFSGGQFVEDQSNLEGVWDNSLIQEIKQLVNWRYQR
ncbi:MAG: RHS repeat-associated core domain-containing protein [Pirellulaceae bacterium]